MKPNSVSTLTLVIWSLISSTVFVGSNVPGVSATHDPTDFDIIALFSGWNSSLPPGTFQACSPSGTASCNPSVREFRGVAFTARVIWTSPEPTHNLAIYPRGTLSIDVDSTDPACSSSVTSNCYRARSLPVSSARPFTSVSFTPAVPPDDFSGEGGYEVYCQFHPGTMHSKLTVPKNPDLDGDGTVTILDIAPMAFAFGSTPTSPTWNIAADIDNDGDVDIVDVATAAIYFGKTLVD